LGAARGCLLIMDQDAHQRWWSPRWLEEKKIDTAALAGGKVGSLGLLRSRLVKHRKTHETHRMQPVKERTNTRIRRFLMRWTAAIVLGTDLTTDGASVMNSLIYHDRFSNLSVHHRLPYFLTSNSFNGSTIGENKNMQIINESCFMQIESCLFCA